MTAHVLLIMQNHFELTDKDYNISYYFRQPPVLQELLENVISNFRTARISAQVSEKVTE